MKNIKVTVQTAPGALLIAPVTASHGRLAVDLWTPIFGHYIGIKPECQFQLQYFY